MGAIQVPDTTQPPSAEQPCTSHMVRYTHTHTHASAGFKPWAKRGNAGYHSHNVPPQPTPHAPSFALETLSAPAGASTSTPPSTTASPKESVPRDIIVYTKTEFLVCGPPQCAPAREEPSGCPKNERETSGPHDHHHYKIPANLPATVYAGWAQGGTRLCLRGRWRAAVRSNRPCRTHRRKPADSHPSSACTP